MGKGMKVAVTRRALLARINRRLSKSGEVLKSTHAGEFYVVSLKLNAIARADVDPAKYGHELGVLKPWEELES